MFDVVCPGSLASILTLSMNLLFNTYMLMFLGIGAWAYKYLPSVDGEQASHNQG